ncbi:MAG: LysR family transcriptional regulator [Reyranellaceae bacterium]
MFDQPSTLAAFVRVVDAKGFSAAAPALGLTPSAVSKLVSRLETRLGARLLQRTTRSLRLTDEGEMVYAAARRIVGDIESLEQQIRNRSGTPQGLLRVTTSLAFASHQLAPALDDFLARHPLVQLDLLPTDRVLDMVEEGIDVAVRIGRLPDSSLLARRIGEDKRMICAAPSYLARRGAPARPEDLLRHECIVARERPHLNRWPFRIDGRIEEIEVAGRLSGGDGEMQLQLGLQGLGIVRLTRLTVAHEVRRGGLVPLLEAFSADEPVPIHAVYAHGRPVAPRVTAFVNFLIERFTPPPWEL